MLITDLIGYLSPLCHMLIMDLIGYLSPVLHCSHFFVLC